MMTRKNYILFAIFLLSFVAYNGGELHAQHIYGEVYGGGHNGTVSSNTNVNITAGEIGNDSLVGTPYGGVFGAGEGATAVVAGNTHVNISGGLFYNHIYGGGKKADLTGNANVNIIGGVIRVNVYGGSRLADVNGYAFVHVHDSLNVTSATPVLGTVYGGNDIGGNVKNTSGLAPAFYNALAAADKPSQMPTAFVRISQATTEKQPYIGNVFGGSDGGYTYVATASGYDVTLPNNRYDVDKGVSVISVETKPLIDRTYLEYDGGTIGNVFAGGDNVTVNQAANIHAASTSTVSATIPKKYLEAFNTSETKEGFLSEFEADQYTTNGDNVTFKYGINRCFGGNNNADMNIRPNWFMRAANINNLYSGGNKGDMTYANGILVSVEGKGMRVQNVFGGCRLSDVHPTAGSIAAETIDGFDFPAGYAARVLIKGGTVYNVYGGNDISGQVYHGANVVIRSDIVNNVYGSGNGSYAYRSNESAKNSDFYFQTNGVQGIDALKALNSHRPNTENVLIDLAGTASDSTFIGGSVFCGGNSATLRDLTGNLEFARAKLKIGSYVVSNSIFLGSNGEYMLNEDVIMGMNNTAYNENIDLTNHEQMAEYMKGVEVAIKPNVEFADDYVDYSTFIGSLFCGGNKGSMSAAGTFNIDFLKKICIYDKLVAGSNDANVTYKADSKKEDGTTSALVNHSYVLGGLITEAHPKVQLNITDLRLEPRRLVIKNVEKGQFALEWNRYKGTADEGDMAVYKNFMHGGNIYGGCYSSGYVNGDVQINISNDVTTPAFNEEIAKKLKDDGTYAGGTGSHPYDWWAHVFEPFVSLITCYGGGYGDETEIWGNTEINLLDSVRIMKARGGGERGWVGKMVRNATTGAYEDDPVKFRAYHYNDSIKYTEITKKQVETAYDATVHLNANILGNLADKSSVRNNVAEMCAGGFAGVVTGNTHAIVDNGCIYTVFGGASNAHIYGSAETIIGENGRPYVTQTVYGANDFGGQIMGTSIHETKNTEAGSIQKVKSNTYVEYIAGEIGYNTGETAVVDSVSPDFGIFGGCYGKYDYRTVEGNKYYGKCVSQPNLLSKIEINNEGGVAEADLVANCFVNISSKTTDPEDKVMRIYGGSQGYPGQMGLADTRYTYLLFNGANANARPTYFAQYLFGAGDCARTWYSRFDAYSGNARHLFGANRGVSYVQNVDVLAKASMGEVKGQFKDLGSSSQEAGMNQSLTYMGERSVLNVYSSMIAPQMDIFASGAFSGTKESYLNLYGGQFRDVYGASIEEGITYLTEVNVPKGSTIKCNAIYGGGKGLFADRPCDIYITTIKYNSEDATVEEGIYGGNRDYRFTRRTMIQIDVPVKNSLGELVNVYGGGKGEHTLSEITFVNLQKGAQVKNVFGGSCEGQVYNKPSIIKYMMTEDYYKDSYTDGDALHSYCLGDVEIGGFNIWKNQEGIKDRVLFPGSGYDLTIGTLAPLSMGWNTEQYEFNADVHIQKGALVTENAYGAGYGQKAMTAGCSAVHLLGGTVLGNVYGGGYGGIVKDTLGINGTTFAKMTDPVEMNTHSKVFLSGGTCTNSFGSGLNGSVFGNAYTYVGREVCGKDAPVSYYDGDPTVNRSLYGGGEQGAVEDTAYVYLYNGHIGYKYDETALYDSLKYVMNIDYDLPTDSILYHNGNVFGGGYGEDANTIHSVVTMTGGIIRNSLYGGGEIATIGRGKIQLDPDGITRTLKEITKPGSTEVKMYGGHVLRDVFGGGRGYSFDLSGNEVIGLKFYADGYVFGKTKVNIFRGEVGTGDTESLNLGYGNVFGGGNVGFVYSGEGTKATETSGKRTKGYYYKGSSDVMTEDCSVLISPYTKVTAAEGVTVNGKNFAQCSYVPTDDLNYLKGKSDKTDSVKWEKMDYLTGVTIHNAIFAGGNVTRGDSKLFADTKTVYGNAVAVLNDIYHRDLISVGTEHTGGIYGDGNLTTVDGFREVCVANYGTDYYSLETEITTEQYYELNDRERAYFQLMYKCITPYGKYALNQTIPVETYNKMDPTEQAYWAQAGFCSVYAGRLLNTIQRADFVGIHGSRIVLQGAQDRTVSVADYMDYAINRVGEVSLNQRESVITTSESADELKHGNYLGFYNTVKYLEALTSDVKFDDKRTTTSTQHPAQGETYYEFKETYINDFARNNATSPNKVALNSGVYLEITTQESTDSMKVYGPITGIVELDLMDLGENLGGAFVYAKNIHGTQSGSMNEQAHITKYNDGARTHQGLTYDETQNVLQTSGNFVHPAKGIVDDCYPGSADITSPAHYWFLRGSIYLYDQYISAYTGSSTAYKADVQIPLTIAAGSHGRLKILAIQPNLYAYYDKSGQKLEAEGKGVVVDGTTYHLNDVVTYWDWSRMSMDEKNMFVHDTYIVMQDFSYNGSGGTVSVAKGDVMLSSDYANLPAELQVAEGTTVPKAQIVRISNATSHTNGYALTADITNPGIWDDRYVNVTDPNDIITKAQYENLTAEQKKNYFVGPSYHAIGGVYGQSDYSKGDIINEEIHGAYTKIPAAQRPADQATVEKCYITTGEVTYVYQGVKKTLIAGVGISKSEYDVAIAEPGNVGKIDEAYVCNGTLQLKESYIIAGDLISTAKYNTLTPTQQNQFSKAYICTESGKYGGTLYENNQNYDALKGWCDLTAEDRSHFQFNYDALDLFIKNLDPDATIAEYDKDPTNPYYNRTVELEYSARCHTATTYRGNGASSDSTYAVGAMLTRNQYEKVPNEMIHYASIKASKDIPVHVVNTEFEYGNVMYAIGDTITEQRWAEIQGTEYQAKVTELTFSAPGTYYYCKESYQVGGQGTVAGAYTYAKNIYGTEVTYTKDTAPIPVGAVISYDNYQHLPNAQKNFTITGVSPVETSTLYVARDANMNDVQKDRVITLIYQYQYDESTSDNQMSTVTERHVVNIHLLFRSGAPSIGRLQVPGAVLPGTTVGLKQPSVTKGAYEILGGGWEIYNSMADADNHINGQPYNNNKTVLYFYQTGKYITYYAKTYLGKTYSNAVPLEVANYHSINDVMADTEHYMYIDMPDVPRNPKIYLDNDAFKNDTTKSELDLLRDLYDLSIKENSPLNPQIKGCQKLDFVLQDDLSPKKYTDWTPLGTDGNCFGNSGYFHGDGHAVTGINAPLFGNMCGNIFNLGVKGSFTGAGVATKANYAANCWVWNENAAGHTGRPIIGNELAASDAGVLVNSYYHEEADAAVKYTASDNAIRKNETAFNNGEVAYALNRYYLLKRYNDNAASKPTKNPYSYWTVNSSNTLDLHDEEGRYLDEDAFIHLEYEDYSGTTQTKELNYVEYRYWDGDFVNADAQIHTTADERYHNGFYYPIYPDDYIFFGQLLNYGYVGGKSHDMYPHSVKKTDTYRLQTANTSSNRVYRAPAYFGNMNKQVAHFNVGCVLPDMYNKEIWKTTTTEVQTPTTHGITITMSGSNIDQYGETLPNGDLKTTKVTTVDDLFYQTRTITTEVTVGRPTNVYPGMTAIDFTGHDDFGYEKGMGATSHIFYTPILDYKTVVDFTNPDQTRNMLVYANSTKDASGYGVLASFLYEPNLVFTNSTYKNVPKVTSTTANAVQGHLINKDGSDYVTDRNHFLVDENNFHCPIAYNMGADKRMWYQRTPCTFSTGNNGYESIVLPFTATLVSAHQKGEITHFYDNDKTNHEYWLRGFQGLGTGNELKFIRPMSGLSDEGYDDRYEVGLLPYEVPNDFLYDYYYTYAKGQDGNQDIYQKYYDNMRTYDSYIYLTANVPYLMAFPGKKFYEFDMSGEFIPSNTLSTINKLDVQNISFLSGEGAAIEVLPATGALQTTHDGYTYQGIFQITDMQPIQSTARVITTEGDKFNTLDKIYLDKPVGQQSLRYMYPFHAYMVVPAGGGVKDFSISEDATYVNDNDDADFDELRITVENRVIHIESYMNEETTVRVVNAAGQLIAIRKLVPEAKVSIPVRLPGVYMVNNQKIHVK